MLLFLELTICEGIQSVLLTCSKHAYQSLNTVLVPSSQQAFNQILLNEYMGKDALDQGSANYCLAHGLLCTAWALGMVFTFLQDNIQRIFKDNTRTCDREPSWPPKPEVFVIYLTSQEVSQSLLQIDDGVPVPLVIYTTLHVPKESPGWWNRGVACYLLNRAERLPDTGRLLLGWWKSN